MHTAQDHESISIPGQTLYTIQILHIHCFVHMMMIMGIIIIILIHIDAHLLGMFLEVSVLHSCQAMLNMPDPLPIPLPC